MDDWEIIGDDTTDTSLSETDEEKANHILTSPYYFDESQVVIEINLRPSLNSPPEQNIYSKLYKYYWNMVNKYNDINWSLNAGFIIYNINNITYTTIL